MELKKALKPIEEMEAAMAELYNLYSDRMKEDPEAAAFFAKLSQDEKSHQQVIQYQVRLIRRNPKMFSLITIDMDGLEQILKEIKILINSPAPDSLEQMVRIALKFENSTAEHYYQTAMTQSNAEVGEFLQEMSLDSANHLKSVQEFAEKRGFIPSAPPKRKPDPSRR